MSKRTILILGSILFCIGGISGAFIHNFWLFFGSRCLMAVAAGMMVSLIPSIISFLYEGKQHTTMMGLRNGTGALLAMLTSFLTGILAMRGLQTASWVFLFYIPIIILEFIFIPKFPPEAKDEKIERVDENGNKIKFGKAAVGMLIFYLLWKPLTMVPNYELAKVVIDRCGGTVADVGGIMTFFTAFLFIVSLCYIFFFNKIGNWIVPLGCIIIAFAHIIGGSCRSIPMAALWQFANAFGMTLIFPWMLKTAGCMVHMVWVSIATCLVDLGNYIGNFATPYFMKGVQAFTGDTPAQFYVYAAIYVIFAIISIFIVIKDKQSGYKLLNNVTTKNKEAAE